MTDWNQRAIDFVVAAGLANQPAHRALAITHTAAHDAAQTASKHVGSPMTTTAVEAAIMAAHCSALPRLLPTQQAAVQAGGSSAPAADRSRADLGEGRDDLVQRHVVELAALLQVLHVALPTAIERVMDRVVHAVEVERQQAETIA